MTGWRMLRVLFAAACCAGAGVPADVWGQHAPAVIIVRVPASATVELQGVTMPGSGVARRFESPPLPAGCRCVYSVAATWHDGQGTVTLRREVPVSPGQQVELDLRPETLTARQPPVREPAPGLRRPDVRREGPTSQERPFRGDEQRPRSFVSRPDWLTAEERELLDWTNRQRAAAGLPPVMPNGRLTRIAREHSAAMARQRTMDHTLNGSTFDDRLSASGYVYRLAAENIAQGPGTPREAVELWMTSPGHRVNLLHPDHRDMGLGIAAGPNGERYYTQVFGAPGEW